MNPSRRITQKDVAKAAKTDQSTVSLALRNHPRIPDKTRAHIVAVAARLGYRPDPMMAALAGYRTRHRAPEFHGTIGWLADSSKGLLWRTNSHHIGFYNSARIHAETLGYKVEIFDIQDMRTGWTRAAQIVRSRGVRGLIVCPQPEPDTHLDSFPWEDFSAVAFGHTLTTPRLDAVNSAHASSIVEMMEQLHRVGYRRIGFALRPVHDQRLAYAYSAGYFTYHHKHGLASLIPVCPDDGIDSDGSILRAWLEKHKPDALISGNNAIGDTLTGWGIKIPRDLGLACAVLPVAETNLSGIREDIEEISRVAVDMLVTMIQRGVRGIPLKPKRVLVESIWVAGKTLRPRSAK